MCRCGVPAVLSICLAARMAVFSRDTTPIQITLEIRAQTQFPFIPAGYLHAPKTEVEVSSG